MPQVSCGFKDITGGATGKDLLVHYGPTIVVNIGFDPAYKPDAVPHVNPAAGIEGIAALVDTGATESCIDSLLVTELNLPIVDKRVCAGAHGAQEVNVHLAQIHVPSLGYTIYGQFAAVHLAAGGQPHKALLGRTFLRDFKMAYDGRTGGVVILSE